MYQIRWPGPGKGKTKVSRPAHLTEARDALADLPADDQARLGVTED